MKGKKDGENKKNRVQRNSVEDYRLPTSLLVSPTNVDAEIEKKRPQEHNQ